MEVKDSTIVTQPYLDGMNWKEGAWEVTVILEFIKLCPIVLKVVIGTRITSKLIDYGTETRRGHVGS